MSSTTTTMDRRTYWCHECDMSLSLIPIPTSTTPSLCPHCHNDFLEPLDSPITNPNHLLFDTTTTDNPYFHRVITHLFNSDHHHPPSPSRLHSPASKSAIESIPCFKITASFLEIDPVVICAVCKEQFVVDEDTKELPCKHIYHPDCIIPWLLQRNSCPVCRFQMPVEDGDVKVRRRSRSRVLRLGDLVDEEEDDEELLGFGLRQLARRHRLVFPMRGREGEGVFSPTQIGEEVGSGRTNSVETVSSWPSWPGEGGEIGDRVNDDDDVVMS